MKKLSSLLLSLIFGCSTCISSVVAQTTFTESLNDNFENGISGYSIGSSSNHIATISDYLMDSSDVYNKVLRWDLSLEKTLKDYYYDIEPLTADGAFARYSEQKNLYAVTSFDISTFGTNKRPLYVCLMNRKANKSHLNVIFQNGSIYLNSTATGKVSEVTYSDNTMMNVKIIEQLSDENGNKTESVKAIYLNGNNILNSPISFATSGYGDNYSRIRLMCAKKNTSDANLVVGCYLDNLSIIKCTENSEIYNNARYDLIQTIKDVEAEKNEYMSPIIKEGIDLYNNPKTDSSEIYEYLENLDTVFKNQSIQLDDIELNDKFDAITSISYRKKASDSRKFNSYIASYSDDGRLISTDISEKKGSTDNERIEFSFENFKITNNNDLTKFFLWNDNFAPITESTEMEYCDLKDWNVYVNDNLISLDTNLSVCLKEKSIMIPVKNVLNSMGIEVTENEGGYCASTLDGKSITFYPNSNTAFINEETVTLPTATYLKDNILLMAPVDVINEAFGAEILIDDTNHNISIIYDLPNDTYYQKNPMWLTVSCSKGTYYVDYAISTWSFIDTINANSKVDVYYKLREYSNDRIESLYFQKAVQPQYSNGKYIGAIGGLRHNHRYDMLIKVTNGDDCKYYLVEKAFQTNEYSDLTYEEMVNPENSPLSLIPTYENIGYYLNIDAASVKLKYRKVGESEWKNAYEPHKDWYIDNCFRGSVTGLESNTEYEFLAELYDEQNNIEDTLSATCTTWNETPVISQTISLSDIYSGNGSLLLTGIKGTSDGWIKIINDTDIVINGDPSCNEAVMVSDCQYLILDGLVVSGGKRNGLNITGSVENIIISNCDISNFGRVGIYNKDTNYYMADGDYVDHDAGIYVLEASKVTIDNCYIHDCKSYTNEWDTEFVENTHPHGGVGIYYGLKGQGVIKNNRIIANEEHMWNDAIEGRGNANLLGGPCRDTDIYGNIISNCNDDAVELDGAAMNVRFYNNKIYNTYNGIGAAPVYVGPTYIFNNLIIANQGIKAGGSKNEKLGLLYVFNNTIATNGNNLRNVGINGSDEYHAITKNNIFFSKTGVSIYNAYVNEKDSNINDMLYGTNYKINSTDTSKVFFAVPDFVEPIQNNYALKSNSFGKGQAVWIDNFNESDSADIGANLN